MSEDHFEALEETLKTFLEQGEDYLSALFPDRPHGGQPHTDTGERGKQPISGITMRDLHDCYIIGCFEASGLQAENYPKTIHELPWDSMDPAAVRNQMLCAVEKRMGIYPNIPQVVWIDEALTQVEALEQKRRKLTSALEKIHSLLIAMRPEPGSPEAALKHQAINEFWAAL